MPFRYVQATLKSKDTKVVQERMPVELQVQRVLGILGGESKNYQPYNQSLSYYMVVSLITP